MGALHGCNICCVWFSTWLNEDYIKKKKVQIQSKTVHEYVFMSTCWGVCGLCLNKHWNFPAFLFLLIYFLSVLFSQYCNASLDITQASLSCSASAESNLVRSTAARRIRLSFFRLLWNVPFFSTSKIHKAAKLLTCVRGAARLLHSFMPHYAKLHIVYLKNTEHFSTIKKHVI